MAQVSGHNCFLNGEAVDQVKLCERRSPRRSQTPWL